MRRRRRQVSRARAIRVPPVGGGLGERVENPFVRGRLCQVRPGHPYSLTSPRACSRDPGRAGSGLCWVVHVYPEPEAPDKRRRKQLQSLGNQAAPESFDRLWGGAKLCCPEVPQLAEDK